ncbi:MAG: hypothetical protein K9G76_01695 [Bacteroidales bacterium]|nr:hypothetical protein [Bacteroidales bacterium]MCF8403267.1 hypothetical protein [Bacteroidales bacterium]
MPQIRLEYSGNIAPPGVEEIFPQIHQLLNELAGIPIGNCKSRLVKLDEYFVSEGEINQAFAHLEIALLEGRSKEIKQKIGNGCLQLLKNHFLHEQHQKDIQITVEVRDLIHDCYFKFPEGTLSK